MSNSKKVSFLIGAIIVIVLVFLVSGDFSMWFGEKKDSDSNKNIVATSTNSSSQKPAYTIEQIPINEKDKLTPKAPDLKREVMFSKNTPEDIKLVIKNKINENIKKIESDPLNYELWLSLGSNVKLAGDYEKVRDIWTYAYALEPNYFVTLINLGDLYGYYLKNNALAEVNFLKAIELAPNEPYVYQRTAEFYIEVINDFTKAKAILEKGLKNTGENQGLKKYLSDIEMEIEKSQSGSSPKPL
jgi:tetratricopeptide (TPR) repeat protein